MASFHQHHGSKSQMCLHKILTIITTVPPPLAAATPPKESAAENDEKTGSGFDLNDVALCNPPEVKDSFEGDSSGLSSSNTTGGGSAACDGCDRVGKELKHDDKGDNRNLAMLIQAAKLIFGEYDKFESGSESGSPEMGGESEVVRSKRAGRRRIVPYKYRDSVLELPLTRLTKRRRR